MSTPHRDMARPVEPALCEATFPVYIRWMARAIEAARIIPDPLTSWNRLHELSTLNLHQMRRAAQQMGRVADRLGALVGETRP